MIMAHYNDIENQMVVLDIEDEANAELTFEGIRSKKK